MAVRPLPVPEPGVEAFRDQGIDPGDLFGRKIVPISADLAAAHLEGAGVLDDSKLSAVRKKFGSYGLPSRNSELEISCSAGVPNFWWAMWEIITDSQVRPLLA